MSHYYSIQIHPINPKLRIHGVKLMNGFELIAPVLPTEKQETDQYTDFIWKDLSEEIFATIHYHNVTPKGVRHNVSKNPQHIEVLFETYVNFYDTFTKFIQINIPISQAEIYLSFRIEEDFLLASLDLWPTIRPITWTLYDLRTLDETNLLIVKPCSGSNHLITIIKDNGYIVKYNVENKILFYPSSSNQSPRNKYPIFITNNNQHKLWIVPPTIMMEINIESHPNKETRNHQYNIYPSTIGILKYQPDIICRILLNNIKTAEQPTSLSIKPLSLSADASEFLKSKQVPTTPIVKSKQTDYKQVPTTPIEDSIVRAVVKLKNSGRMAGSGEINTPNPY